MLNWFRKQPETNVALLAELLSSEAAKKEFLGFGAPVPPSFAQKAEDVAKAVRYTKSEDFKPVAKEIWAKVVRYVDLLSSATTPVEPGSNLRRPLTTEEINFTRGCLKEALDILSISYKAQLAQEELARRNPTRNSPAPRA